MTESASAALNSPPKNKWTEWKEKLTWANMKEKAKSFTEADSLDSHFPYAIPRTITVQDARMGISYYVLFFGILLFMFFYQMGLQGGHIAFEGTFGQVSFQVKRPTAASVPLYGENSYWNLSDSDRCNSPAGFKPINQLPYCRNNTDLNTFCSTDPTNDTYYCTPMSCAAPIIASVYDNVTNTTQNVTTGYKTTGRCANKFLPGQVYNCRYIDEDSIASIVNEKSIMILTRMAYFFQNQTCLYPPSDSTPCVNLYHAESSTQKYLTVQPEDFEIMFDHQVFTPTNGVTGTQTEFIDAPLIMPDGVTMYYPAYIDPTANGGNGSYYRPDNLPWIPGYHQVLGRHVMSVQTLLNAGGCPSLDTASPGLFDGGSTYRYTGVTVMIQINYNNYNAFAYSTTKYPEFTYSVVLGTTYAALHQVTWNGLGATNNSRLFENRHGVKIYIEQEGQLGSVSIVQLMLFFGSAAAFFGIAALLVDNIVIRFFVSKRTQELLDLAGNTTMPTRAELDSYVKSWRKKWASTNHPRRSGKSRKSGLSKPKWKARRKPAPTSRRRALLNSRRFSRENRLSVSAPAEKRRRTGS